MLCWSGTVQYIQYSTVLYSTRVQYSTVQYIMGMFDEKERRGCSLKSKKPRGEPSDRRGGQ